MSPAPALLQRIRASATAARTALRQLEQDLADASDAGELARALRELFREDAPDSGVLGSLGQLLTTAAHAADRVDPDGEGDASCPLHEAAAHVTDSAGLHLHYATRSLDPQGERTPAFTA
jgi:hypothetical protein